MPARKKPAGTQQDRRPQRPRVNPLAVVKAPPETEIPLAPRPHGGLLVKSTAAWESFWLSCSAKAAEQVDRIVAERWILAYDEWHRALNAVRKARLVAGSMGQPVLNPLAAYAAGREAAMEKCERQLGIGPKFRADLGVTVGHAQLTAHELNALTEGGDGEVIDVDPEEEDLLGEFEAAT